MATPTLTAAAAAVGILSHVLYFNRGEHHMWAIPYTATFAVTCAASIAALIQVYETPVVTALSTTAVFASSYLTGLVTSLLVFRIWLSPLNKFPGPFLAKITGLWLTVQASNCDLYLKLEELHKKYGPYVRTGPNTLSIVNADVHDAAFDQKNPWRKAEWYDAAHPYDSMHTTRNKALHDRRRRVWAPAFSDKALREYEVKVDFYNNKLVDRLRQFGGGVVNASKWFNLYSFDVMGQLSFGKNYRQLETGKFHEAIGMLNESMEATPPRVPVWLVRVLILTPNETAKRIFKFLKFCRDELAWRCENVNSEGDITGWILKAYKDFKSPADDTMFQGDARLIIVAGSDTTAATMSFLFYHLAKDPAQAEKIRKELQPLTKGEWNDASIRNAPHLNGAINEALRLHPPVPSGVERLTPVEGAQYGDVRLPPNVQFWMPQYVIGRSEEYYENALEFLPERWYSQSDKIKHKNAFAPFSLGSQGCIGKNLAYMELRTLTAQLLLNFDVSLAPNEDGHRLLYKTRDHFTLGLGELDLQFKPIAS